MKKILLLLVVVTCLGLVRCAYHGPLTSLPVVKDADAAELVFIRGMGFKAGGLPMYIAIDGVNAYALENGAYTSFKVSAGEHSVMVWMFESEKGRTHNTSNSIKLTLKAGDKRYLYMRTNHNPWTAWTIIEEISRQEGEELLQSRSPSSATPDREPPQGYI
jgi:hypothetical protein